MYCAMRIWIRSVIILSAVGLLSCSEPQPPPNIILISIDTTRRDHLSVYGYHLDTTPRLSGLFEEGAKIDMAYSPSATTGPSHTTMLTGAYPIAHRVIKNGLTLGDDVLTLPELLNANGYQTAAVISAFVLDGKFGLSQGFDLYHDDLPISESTHIQALWENQLVSEGFDRRSDYTSSHAIKWLREARDPDRPFFMFVHYFAPHYPYVPPPEFAERFVPEGTLEKSYPAEVGLYDAEIAFTDAEIGRLIDVLDGLGLKDDTIVVVTADHGEGLMQHDWMFHGVHIYEEAVRVPLIFRFPKQIPSRQEISGPVELTDLAPTLLDLIGMDVSEGAYHGRSLAAALRGQSDLDEQRPVFLHRRPFQGDFRGSYWAEGEVFGVREGQWKYLEGKEEKLRQLFDLDQDPKEKENLIEEFPDIAKKLARKIEQWKLAHQSAEGVINQMTDEDIEKLRALGYIQ